MLRRRDFIERGLAATVAGAVACSQTTAPLALPGREPFRPKWLVASSLYGCPPLQAIALEVAKTGSHAIDIWPLAHGKQREPIEEMGEKSIANLLENHRLSLGCLTQFKLGPLVEALQDVRYDGWVEIFMHPFPRGVPILETASEVTAEINRARNYLQQFT